MKPIPMQRYQGQVVPGELIILLTQLGVIAPLGYRRDGSPIWPIEGGDGTAPISLLERVRASIEAEDTAMRSLVETAQTEQRDLTEAEQTDFEARTARRDQLEARIPALEAQEQRAAQAATIGSQSQPGRPLSGVVGARVQVTSNEEVYRRGGDQSFFGDILAVRNGDADAAERLRRNNAAGDERERRDGTSTSATSFGSFIPPVWLLNELAEKARVGRVLAPFMRDGGFPTTTSITVPRITTGSSAAGQAGDNAAVSETDIVTAQLARSTVTIAGQQDVAQQAFDLSPFPVDRVIFADLEAAYQAELDRQILRGSGSNELLGINQVSSILTVTYTDASPTAAELMPKFGDAMSQIHGARFAPAQLAIMHPRRWAWISTAVDSTGRPLGVPAGLPGFNPQAQFGAIAAQGIVGMLSNGLPVVATGSCSTALGAGTEDQIVVTRPDDMILFEAPLRARTHEQTLNGNLTVRLQLFSYVNFFAGRFPASIATINGTGLIAPTF